MNQLATVSQNDLSALAEAARDDNRMVGRPLRFKKGKWMVSREEPGTFDAVSGGDLFCADILSYACGWVKWKSNKPVARHVYRPIDGWLMPTRDRMPDNDPQQWEFDEKLGKNKDPWQEQHQIVMKWLEKEGQNLVTWQCGGFYQIKNIRKLIAEYVHHANKHIGAMPVVQLGTYDERSRSFGDIPAPKLTIVNWEEFGPEAAPPGMPRQRALPSPQSIAAEPVEHFVDDEIPF